MLIEKNHDRLMLNDRAYSTGKKLVQVYIPATSSLYFGLAAIWGLPSAEEVVGTLAVLATFLGVTLGISSKQYDASEAAFDGQLLVTASEDGPTKMFSLELNGDPEELENKESIRFKVVPQEGWVEEDI